ncbi:DUF4232 domain-containing protein [Nocardia concava]|uniref:DUF4232 domain-containing protein n=1 Tax=Nocardia concava TaxID=257281 RepID=UPI001FDEFC69|nr:DUF4232 domain-containing protein [Nocardia concava]
MRFRGGIFVVAVGSMALAAGCSNSNTQSPPFFTTTSRTATTTAMPDGSVDPTGTTGASATTPPGTPTALAPYAACGKGQVDVTAEVMSPGTGHRGVKITFALAPGAAPCTLTGYPGVDTGAGGPLLHADRTPRGYMGGLPQGSDEPPAVTLLSGHPANAVVEGVAFDSSGSGCPLYTSLLVTPPNTTDTRTVAVTIDSCALHVHPVTG